ncbi:hypothetical protein C2E23DRAFT_136269 [Lenzites betulinus]|nr:hypothetical protein C2E23DRAFT_136269 [Lenzites betulinus]
MSASSAATQTAATILLYQTTRVYNICGIAAIALFLYDYALCLDREYNFVWRSGKSKASTRLLYLLNRYTHLSSCILELVIIPPVLNVTFLCTQSCTVIIWTLTCAELLELIGTAMLTTIRTYVLSGQNKPLGAIAFILSLGPFLVNTSATYQFLPINLPPPQNCVQASTGSVLLNLG